MPKPTLAPLLAACLLLAAGAPAVADWLVMKDGTRLEIEGAWEERGSLVVFTLPGGTLSSLRASKVDLEASVAATEEAARPPAEVAEPEPAPKPKAKFVFTEKELPPVSRVLTEEGSPEAEGAAAPSSGETSADGDERLKVTAWNVVTPDDFDGSQVVGQIRNVGGELLTSLSMVVHAFNASGTPLGRVAAEIPPGALPADRVVDFTALFPAVYGITAIKFDLRAGGFLEEGGEEQEAAPAVGGEEAGAAVADAAAASQVR